MVTHSETPTANSTTPPCTEPNEVQSAEHVPTTRAPSYLHWPECHNKAGYALKPPSSSSPVTATDPTASSHQHVINSGAPSDYQKWGAEQLLKIADEAGDGDDTGELTLGILKSSMLAVYNSRYGVRARLDPDKNPGEVPAETTGEPQPDTAVNVSPEVQPEVQPEQLPSDSSVRPLGVLNFVPPNTTSDSDGESDDGSSDDANDVDGPRVTFNDCAGSPSGNYVCPALTAMVDHIETTSVHLSLCTGPDPLSINS
eukprot:gene18857-25409_t